MSKFNTIKKLLIRFYKDCQEFSFKVAYARLYRDCPWITWSKRREQYENAVYNYLKKHYSKYDINIDEKEQKNLCVKSETIWVMWWQGKETMPPIVKACYERLKEVGLGRQIVLITKDNIYKYLSIPQYVQEKVDNGQITLTHFSDIVRVMLLAQYGGSWIDATVYVSTFPEDFFKQELFTLKKDGLFKEFISRGGWSSFFLYAGDYGKYFEYLRELFFSYWKEHKVLIDYLMIDYFIKLTQDIFPQFKEIIERVPETEMFYNLNLMINEAYKPETFEVLCAQCCFHKLTYKKEFLNKNEKGNETYYHHLIYSSLQRIK